MYIYIFFYRLQCIMSCSGVLLSIFSVVIILVNLLIKSVVIFAMNVML